MNLQAIINRLTAVLLTLGLSLASAQETSEPEIFEGFWTNVSESFFSDKAYYHLTGIALTPLLIKTGVDADVHDAFDNDSSLDPGLYLPGVIGGGLGPLLLGVPIYVHGKMNSDAETIGAAYALTQSTIIALSYISLLKGLTGRPAPDNDRTESTQEQSEHFRFGILRGGIFEGWPSGHVGVTTALITTLTHYYPEKVWLKWTGYGTVAYMMLTVSAFDDGQMHWFSDAVAGALMGYAIGSTVGSNFRAKLNGDSPHEENVLFLPLVSPQGAGAQMVWRL